MILDVGKAVNDGCIPYPAPSLFRGEKCEVVKKGSGKSDVWIRLPNSLDPKAVYNVDQSHLILEKEDME